MTLPSVVRIFFAIEIPGLLKEELGRYLSALKKASKTHSIRWTKPDNLHITLQFLAHVRAQDIDGMIKCVTARLQQGAPCPVLRLAEPRVFPSSFRPRVIVLDVVPPNDMTVLSRLVGEGIQAAGYEIEQKPYRPHLTLGRIKQPQDIHLQFLSSVDLPDFGVLKPEAVTLYRSEPYMDGSQYTVIDRLSLPLPIQGAMP